MGEFYADKYEKILNVLTKHKLVTYTKDAIYLNLDMKTLPLTYIPFVGCFRGIIFGKRYKLFYLNTNVGNITFTKKERHIGDDSLDIQYSIYLIQSDYFNEIREAIDNNQSEKKRSFEVISTPKKETSV